MTTLTSPHLHLATLTAHAGIEELVAAVAARTPDAVALVFGSRHLTYGELDARVNQVAHYLRAQGVGSEVRVGLAMERSLELVVGLLGILRAGGAYVPLDPAYPAERLAYMLADSGAGVLLTQPGLTDRLPAFDGPTIPLDATWAAVAGERQEAPQLTRHPDNLAYVIYTSGSTGRPKGVLVAHRGLFNLVEAQRAVFAQEPEAHILQFASISFDASIFEILLAVGAGATLYLAPQDRLRPGPDLLRLLSEAAITTVTLTPSVLAVLPPAELPALHTIIAAGEACPAEVVARWSQGRRFFNAYGPTETTVWATTAECAPGEARPSIGRPIPNAGVYLLDAAGQPVGAGEAGELCVGGIGLARGYHARPDLTAERFIPHPFSPTPGARLYRTGDLARRRANGTLDYLGRVDQQVKIRGFRIEPGEIETALGQHPAVREAVVVAREDTPGDKRLVAYVVPDREAAATAPGAALPAEQVAGWQRLYETTYGQAGEAPDPTFNIGGWNSSYTGLPIPADEMREWVDATVVRVLAHRPRRVLEIGCGLGLLLFRIAPHCAAYYATDFAQPALDYIERHLRDRPLPQVRLFARPAHALGDLLTGSGHAPAEAPFDVVILNSVTQYFPGADYLRQVLEAARVVTAPGGVIFVGDVRSLPLLPAFQTAVQLAQAPPDLPTAELAARVRQRIAQEEELVIDPSFFSAVAADLGLGRAEIQLKRGRAQNELTAFRYDVRLHVDSSVAPGLAPIRHDWTAEGLSLEAGRALLTDVDGAGLALSSVPNVRMWAAVQAAAWLDQGRAPATAGELRAALATLPGGIEPEDLWALGAELGYAVEIQPSGENPGACDAVFWRPGADAPGTDAPAQVRSAAPARPWRAYTNDPLGAGFARRLVPALRDFLQRTLPAHMMPGAFVVLDRLLLTPNGKVDRRALPAPDPGRVAGPADFVAPRTPVETALAGIWAAVLGLERVGIDDNFFEVGGHSLLATQVVSRVRDALDVELPLAALFESPTVAGLAARLAATPAADSARDGGPIPRATRGNTAPLSFAQQRLWFFDQLLPNSALYNVPTVLRLRGSLDLDALRRALDAIVRRHETLRTTFVRRGADPVQVITPPGSVPLPLLDLRDLPQAEAQARTAEIALAETRRPFDLAAGPLFRVNLLRLGEQEYMLLLTLHHIISDAWSMAVLVEELAALYPTYATGQPIALPPLPIQYADYAIWQRERLQSAALESLVGAWREHLAGTPPVLALPTDHPRPPTQSFRGATETLLLPRVLAVALEGLGRQEGATLFMTLFAAFQALLARLSGQIDLVVGAAIAGRTRAEVEPLIGFFVNTLPLRGDLSGNPPFRELLARTRAVALWAYAHQELPFDKLVEALNPPRNLSYNPICQVIFALENAPPAALRIAGLAETALEVDKVDTGTARFDLSLAIEEAPDGLLAALEYSTELFEPVTIRRLLDGYRTLLEGAVAQPETRLADLPLLSAAAQRTLLAPPARHSPAARTLHAWFAEQAARAPGAVAVTYENAALTYGELDQRANRLAHYLQRHGVGPDVPVALYMDRSLDLVVGILGILKAGGCYLPLDPAYPAERLAFMLADAGAPVLLTQERMRAALPDSPIEVVSIDSDWPRIAPQPPTAPPDQTTPAHLAYIIYTSGSTGAPKGTPVTHANVVRLMEATAPWYGFDTRDVWTLFHSYAFDFSVWELWGALLYGGRLVIVPYWVSRTPDAFYALLADEGVTVLNQTPSAFRQLIRAEESAAEPRELALRYVIFGGEALELQSLRPWFVRHGDTCPQLVNMYGITETTVHVTYRPIDLADVGRGEGSVIGVPIPDLTVYILDSRLRPVPPGVPGEMFVAGAGLARGYLNRPDLTAQRFIPDPFSGELGARLYRSGDLARWTAGGDIEYLGRIDHQVKIRGFRIELGEIEAALGAHPAAREVSVLAREDTPGEKRLAAYLVAAPGSTEAPPTVGALRDWLRAMLPDYMVPAAFVWLDRLPLTTNGKVDRRALPAPDTMRPKVITFVAPRTPVEEVLAAIWADVLGLDRVGVADNFFDLGGHSLLATQVVARIRDALGIAIPLRRLFESPTVAGLAAVAETQRREEAGPLEAPLRPAARTGDPPLSFAQQRLWFLDRLEPGNAFYNIPLAARLHGPLDPAALEASLNAVVARHEVLRTTFADQPARPVQVIAPALSLPLPLVDLADRPAGESADLRRREAEAGRLATAEAARPFDLARGPLLRALLLRLGADEHILVLTLHHAIADGWSLGVLLRELAAFCAEYTGGPPAALPALPVQYADYALWQRDWLRGAVLDAQLAYWKTHLAGSPAALDLPTDYPRPAIGSYRGARQTFVLPADLRAALETLGRREGATLYMTLLAAFATLLSRYSGQTDLVVGTPIAGRGRAELEDLLGFFVNTLALRVDLAGQPTFRALLGRVRETALGAYAHQDLPFEKLVEALQPERNLSRQPIFQVMFALQNRPLPPHGPDGRPLDLLDLDTGVSAFDLTLGLETTADGLTGYVEYSTDLFAPETISRMLGHYRTLLEGAVAAPEAPGVTLPLLPPTERRQILADWNATACPRPADATIHALVAAQAGRTPAAPAVVAGDQTLTYAELDARAAQLARYLRGLGVGPDVPVGLCLPRTLDLPVALLGILKAGGAYLPLDPAYPPARLAYMLADCGAPVVLTTAELRTRLSDFGLSPDAVTDGSTIQNPQSKIAVVCLDTDTAAIAAAPAAPPPAVHGEHGAYIIYTSGSTGRPKGVLVPHRALVNHGLAAAETYALGPADRVLQFASISFDVATEEIFPAWLSGATLVLHPEPALTSFAEFHRFLTAARLTVLNLPTPYWQEWTADLARDWTALPPDLRLVVVGSDRALPEPLSVWGRLAGPRVRWLNAYGPTEATVTATVYAPDPASPPAGDTVPIGRPLANVRAYVLDAGLEPVPVGVPGMLYLGGAGLARGYLGQPALTAARFIPDPFSAAPGARLYCTGDRARWRPDGNLVFLGRADTQVKIRGFRIEMGEVEAALSAHPAVQDAVVVAREDSPGAARLVAYVVAAPEAPPGAGALRAFLTERLPGYMVPTAFVTLAALPRTANGKLDRRALPAPEPGERGRSAGPAPRDDVEQRLAAIWEAILGAGPVGADDNFFDLGGHSLLAVRLLAQIQTTFGVALPLAALFQGPTLADLARNVRQTCICGPQSPVVPIQSAGHGTPFFCVHPVSGSVLSYVDLARALGDDQPFYGLQAPGLDDAAVPLRRMDDLAARYVVAIRQIQPQGPYLLGGWSLGGVIALEMARQLDAAGQPVGLLALIDSYAPALTESGAAPDTPALLRSFAHDLGARAGRPLLLSEEDLRAHPEDGQIAYVWERAVAAGLLPGDMSMGQVARRFAVYAANLAAAHAYRPAPVRVPITLFCAGDECVRGRTPTLGWQPWAAAGLELHVVPGDHYTLIQPPAVATLAERLRACLSHAMGAAGSAVPH